MQPKLWAQKAPEYVNDARQMGIQIQAPYIQKSGIGFTIEGSNIYFGFNAIAGVGATASASIISARKRGPFKDIWDFLGRVNKQKVNTATFKKLATAGAFDRMGYRRKDLIENCSAMYKYLSDCIEYEQRLVDMEIRSAENMKKDERKNELEEQLARAKQTKKEMKKARLPLSESVERILNRKDRLREMKKLVRESGSEPHEILFGQDLEEFNEATWLRKKPALKEKPLPVKPDIERTRSINITVLELMNQAKAIGCYLHDHPAPTLYKDTTRITDAEEGHRLTMAGQITNIKKIKTRRGQEMAFAEMGDGTGLVELVIFPKVYAKLNLQKKIPEIGDIVRISCEVETADDSGTKVFVNDLSIHEISIKTNRLTKD